jgi:hypothetical protein
MAARWREEYRGGSPEAERVAFQALAQKILAIQAKTKRRSKENAIARAFHVKSILAVEGAVLQFSNDLPEDLCVGFAQPGCAYPVAVRFSNAHGTSRADTVRDLRGVALRVQVADCEQHDLLLINTPVSLARDAHQYVTFAAATTGNRLDRILGLGGMIFALGPREAWRMVSNAHWERDRTVATLALETYWSQGAMRWGDEAVRYQLRPTAEAAPAAADGSAPDAGYLRRDLARRLKDGDVAFDLYVQRFVDERTTPIEDAQVEWPERVARPLCVARLTIAAQDVGSLEARSAERRVDALAFNPWNTSDEFRPLGNINRARKVAYDVSAEHRLGRRWAAEIPLRNRVFGGIAAGGYRLLNRHIEWHRLSPRLSVLNIDMLRQRMRLHNLIDTESREAPPRARTVPPPIDEPVRTTRAADGSFNDLCDPKMGAIGARFGRNMPPVYRPDLFNEPNPIEVSRKLLYRETFIPAKSLNILAAAWIQFQVHDWVNHARYPLGKKDVAVPLPPGMRWRNRVDGGDEAEMRIAGDVALNEADSAQPPIMFANQVSHWWDGSEVYGADGASANKLRERLNGTLGAKLRLDDGHLPQDVLGMEVTGFNQSWWLGLSAMHTLFAREHNLLCDELRSHYRSWTDERVYQTARLIVSALIAKIHTTEWTPAILATKAVDMALDGNWNGPRPDDWLTRLVVWLVDTHALKGIPKTMPDHHTAPYAQTEEFVTVYRLHPLMPDDYQLFRHTDAGLIGNKSFLDIQGAQADEVMREVKLENALYSFGIAYPGAITLHNFPRALQTFERDGEIIDLSVVDIVRSRRRGVPRFNDFRAGLHKKRFTRFEDMTADPESVRLLKEVYRGDVDLVDTVVGLLAETPPQGFGFSDTAFRIFMLMATRRLQSDRFLTVDFRPEIYSPFGMDWIEQNTMSTVILRHCPELAASLPRSGSAFAPWRPVGTG